jgi:hypothetical protein
MLRVFFWSIFELHTGLHVPYKMSEPLDEAKLVLCSQRLMEYTGRSKDRSLLAE